MGRGSPCIRPAERSVTVSEVKKWETMKRNAEQALKRNLPERERRIELGKLKDAIQQIRLLRQKGAAAGK